MESNPSPQHSRKHASGEQVDQDHALWQQKLTSDEQKKFKAYDSGIALTQQGNFGGVVNQADPKRSGLADAVFDTLLNPVDFESILSGPKAEKTIQKLPPQRIYASLALGDEDTQLSVIEKLSKDQYTRLIDYDSWQGDSLDRHKFAQWLKRTGKISPKEMAKRFCELDEEYQLAAYSNKVQFIDREEWESLPQSIQDSFVELPCHAQFYRLVDCDSELMVEQTQKLIDALLEYDLPYAYSFLAHSAFMPPNEQEAMINQFRKARMTEDGFAEWEESISCFMALAENEFHSMVNKMNLLGSKMPKQEEGRYLAQTSYRNFDELSELFDDPEELNSFKTYSLAVLNQIIVCASIEISDKVAVKKAAEFLFGQIRLALDLLSGGEKSLAEIVVKSYHPKTLLRYSQTVISKLKMAFIDLIPEEFLLNVGLSKEFTKKWGDLLDRKQFGHLLDYLDQVALPVFGLKDLEILKRAFNRFPYIQEWELEVGHEQPNLGQGKSEGGKYSLSFKAINCREDIHQLAAQFSLYLIMMNFLEQVQELKKSGEINNPGTSSTKEPLLDIESRIFACFSELKNDEESFQACTALLSNIFEKQQAKWDLGKIIFGNSSKDGVKKALDELSLTSVVYH